jgi:hypothetical protein
MRKVVSFMVSTAGWWPLPLGDVAGHRIHGHPAEKACRERKG